MSFLVKTICFILFAIPAGVILSGSIYLWTDSDGIQHFSNISPPEHEGARKLAEEKIILPRGHQFTIVKIFDGDTIQVKGFGLRVTIRLAGIDTPEIGRRGQKSQPYSLQAKQKLAELVQKRPISLKQYGLGGYNRVLAEVFIDETNVNLEMVRSGLAEVYRGKRPDAFDAAPYFKAEHRAKQLRRGMWRQGAAYTSPRQWRQKYP